MKKTIVIGYAGRRKVEIDIDALIESRLLVQANSGGGKSYALRRLLEQTHGVVQQIVIDVEHEFHTLREKYDYVLAGKGGECPVTIQSADLLARRLLELQVSAIVQIDELKKPQRFTFVKRFLEALVEAPDHLHQHDCMVVLDEAHLFAPEKTKAESTVAVIDLMTRGRKRGLCGVLATQRIAKLSKDATAETNTKLIGRASMDIDQKRAAFELGFSTRDDIQSLRKLKPGEFYAFGPAISDDIQRIKVGKVSTTHPKRGQRRVPVPPPRRKIKLLLAELHDLPEEAAEEARSLADAKKEIQHLKRELRVAQKDGGVDPAAVAKKVAEAVEAAKRRATASAWDQMEKILADQKRSDAKMHAELSKLAESALRIKALIPTEGGGHPQPPSSSHSVAVSFTGGDNAAQIRDKTVALINTINGNGEAAAVSHNSGEGRMLIALVQRYPDKLTLSQIATLSNLKRNGGSFRTYKSKLKVRGFIQEIEDGLWQATEEGIEALGGNIPDPQTPEEIVAMWKSKLTGKAKDMLDLLLEHYPAGLTLDDLAYQLSMERNGGTFRTYVSKLRANGLATTEGETIQASSSLFQ